MVSDLKCPICEEPVHPGRYRMHIAECKNTAWPSLGDHAIECLQEELRRAITDLADLSKWWNKVAKVLDDGEAETACDYSYACELAAAAQKALRILGPPTES